MHWMCYIITTFLTKSLQQEESSIYKNMLHKSPKPMLYIFCIAAVVHTHWRWITKVGNTPPPPRQYVYWCNSLRCTFLPARLLSTHTDPELWRQETHRPPTHILLKQPVLHISCCTFLQQGYCKHYIYLCTPTDSGLRRQETHSPPHIY